MPTKGQSTIHRRGFLGTLVAAGAVGVTSLAPFRLNAMQEKMMSNPGSSGFDDWLNKIRGKHRQAFDVPYPVGGLPLAQVRVFLMTNKAVGVSDDDVQAVIVLRHEAIPLAMDSALWKKYNFSKVFDVVDGETKKPITQNVFWHPKEGALPLPGMSIDELMKSGALFGVCDMAMTVASMHVAKKMKLKAEDVKKEWVAGVLPGIQVVPSGVLAVNRAQEHGCTYCYLG
jgi:intracellular sulfur oxidation DsrE/DsrF family protein